jgi:hypothetical protein
MPPASAAAAPAAAPAAADPAATAATLVPRDADRFNAAACCWSEEAAAAAAPLPPREGLCAAQPAAATIGRGGIGPPAAAAAADEAGAPAAASCSCLKNSMSAVFDRNSLSGCSRSTKSSTRSWFFWFWFWCPAAARQQARLLRGRMRAGAFVLARRARGDVASAGDSPCPARPDTGGQRAKGGARARGQKVKRVASFGGGGEATRAPPLPASTPFPLSTHQRGPRRDRRRAPALVHRGGVQRAHGVGRGAKGGVGGRPALVFVGLALLAAAAARLPGRLHGFEEAGGVGVGLVLKQGMDRKRLGGGCARSRAGFAAAAAVVAASSCAARPPVPLSRTHILQTTRPRDGARTRVARHRMARRRDVSARACFFSSSRRHPDTFADTRARPIHPSLRSKHTDTRASSRTAGCTATASCASPTRTGES